MYGFGCPISAILLYIYIYYTDAAGAPHHDIHHQMAAEESKDLFVLNNGDMVDGAGLSDASAIHGAEASSWCKNWNLNINILHLFCFLIPTYWRTVFANVMHWRSSRLSIWLGTDVTYFPFLLVFFLCPPRGVREAFDQRAPHLLHCPASVYCIEKINSTFPIYAVKTVRNPCRLKVRCD